MVLRPRDNIFDQEAIDRLWVSFCEYAELGARGVGVDPDDVSLSEKEFGDAMWEVAKDVLFLTRRRTLRNGLSHGKVAGTLVFRLCRHRLIHFHGQACNEHLTGYLQEMVVVQMVTNILLGFNFSNPWILERTGRRGQSRDGREQSFSSFVPELMFLMKRRHPNQESLGLFFESLICLRDAIADNA